MRKRLIASLLTVCMLLALLPTAALAEGTASEVCTREENCQAETHDEGCLLYQAPSTETCTRGENCQAKNHQEGCPFYRITAISAESYDQTVTVSNESSDFSDIQTALNALGKNSGNVLLLINKTDIIPTSEKTLCSIPTDKDITSLTIGTTMVSGVTVGQYGSYYIYANGIPLVVDSGVTLKNAMIFGGGDQDFTANTSITVNVGASVGTIYGGGHDHSVNGDVSITVYGKATTIFGGGYAHANSNDDAKVATANVTGNNITITVSGEGSEVYSLHGGGHAYVNSSKEAEQTLQANVIANITIDLNCKLKSSAKIYGGGNSDVVMSTKQNMSTRKLNADVKGNIKITVGGDTQSASSFGSDFPYFYGGGYANTGINADNKITPDVLVSANVDGNTEINASQDDHATSGYDDTDASMVRQMYGGGVATGKFSTAQVTGNTSVTTSRKGRGSGGIDLGGIYGGGQATQAGNARVGGNTYVKILRAVSQADGHENAQSVIGGGAAGSGADATVEGSTTVVIEDNIAFESYGKGVIGGGRASEPNAIADVLGGVSLTLNGNINITKDPIIGGGHAYGENSSAKVGSADNQAKITVNILGTISNAKYLYGAGYAEGTNSDASVYGDVVLLFKDATYTTHNVGLGGEATGNNATLIVHGDTSIQVEDSTINWFYPAGYRVTVEGDSTVLFLGNSTVEGCHVKGNLTVENNSNTGWVKGKFNVIVGDGKKKTAAVSKSNLYCNNTSAYVSIYDNATLTGTDTQYNLLWYVEQLDIAKNGTLVLAKTQNPSTNLSGEGTIVLPDTNYIAIDNDFSGNITLKTVAQIKNGLILAWSKPGTTGTFTYGGEGYSLVRTDTGTWYRWDLVSSKTVTATVEGDGGTINPAFCSVPLGDNAVFTITREPGYKVSKIMVGSEDKTSLLSGDTFTLSDVQNDTAVSVTFEKMTAEDVGEIAKELPEIEDGKTANDDQKQTILDTKLDYETLPEIEKAKISEDEKKKLNDALSKLPDVKVEVKVEVKIEDDGGNNIFIVPDDQKPALLENMTKDEATDLKSGKTTEYKIVVVVADAMLDLTEETSIQNALNGAQAAQKHAVIVKKIIKNNSTEDEKQVTELAKPIQLVFAIPSGALL